MPASLAQRLRHSYKVTRAVEATQSLFWAALAPARRLALPALLRQRAGRVHIQFGCGPVSDPRFVNVDARPMRHVHLVTRSPMLRAFPAGCAEALYACHVFEHFEYARQAEVLKRWREVLKPGGCLRLSVPDFDKLLATYRASGGSVRAIQPRLLGGQDYAGNYHFAIFTRQHLADLLAAAGFAEIREWHPRDEADWPRDWSWADEVSLNLAATRPHDAPR